MWPFRHRRGRALFRPYELVVIDAVRAALPAEAAALYDRQIEAVEQVGRIFGGEEIYIGPKGVGLDRFDAAIAFTNRSLEYKLATLRVQGPLRSGKVTVTAVMGHAGVYTFSPGPKQLGLRDGITVTKVTVHVDPTKPDDGSEPRRRLEGLAPGVRRELETAWSTQPNWSAALLDASGVYEITLEDGAYLVLAQLDDTTFVVAGVDPARRGVRRYEPGGDLIGEYTSVEEAIASARRSDGPA